jgi:DNA primase
VIVMEGPTDVMAADQAGYGECVAVLGTALTPEHARQLGNLVGAEGRILLLLDGDRAGQANGLKAVKTCLSVGVPVRVALLPEELDPAELLAEGQASSGAGAPDALAAAKQVFERVLADSRGDLDHLLRALAPKPYELDQRRRLAIADEVLAALRPMPDATLRALHLRDAAEWFGLGRDWIDARLAGAAPPAARVEAAAAEAPAEAPIAPLSASDDAIFHVLAKRPDLRAHAADDLELEPSHFPEPWSALAFALLQEATDVTALLALPEVQKHQAVREAAYRWTNTELAQRTPDLGEPRASLDHHVAALRLRLLQDELLRLSGALTDAASAGDTARMASLAGERFALELRIKDLRGLSGAAS